MRQRRWKWVKIHPQNEKLTEATKDYFPDGDKYINAENGWVKKDDDFVDVEIKRGNK